MKKAGFFKYKKVILMGWVREGGVEKDLPIRMLMKLGGIRR